MACRENVWYQEERIALLCYVETKLTCARVGMTSLFYGYNMFLDDWLKSGKLTPPYKLFLRI